MDLPSVTNAPRVLVLDGTSYRARTLTLGQLGEVLAWLDDRLSGANDSDDDEDDPRPPVKFSGETSRIALATTDGLALILHLSLLSCHPGLTRDQARTLAATMTVEDEARLLATAFRRRLDVQPSENDRSPKDLAEVNWGEIFEALTDHRAADYEAAAAITLDQLDNVISRGKSGNERILSPREVQALWDAAAGPDSPPTGAASDA